MIKEFNDMKMICKKNGVKLSKDIIYDPDKEYPCNVICFDMIKYEENKKLFTDEVWNSESLFFRKCTTDNKFILFRDFTKDYPTVEEVSKIIRENNGKVFLAHLFIYNFDDHMKNLKKISLSGLIDGVETYYSNFTNEQIEILKKYCRKNKLLMSGGSDCHGEKPQNLKLGIGFGNLVVDENVIKEWI